MDCRRGGSGVEINTNIGKDTGSDLHGGGDGLTVGAGWNGCVGEEEIGSLPGDRENRTTRGKICDVGGRQTDLNVRTIGNPVGADMNDVSRENSARVIKLGKSVEDTVAAIVVKAQSKIPVEIGFNRWSVEIAHIRWPELI